MWKIQILENVRSTGEYAQALREWHNLNMAARPHRSKKKVHVNKWRSTKRNVGHPNRKWNIEIITNLNPWAETMLSERQGSDLGNHTSTELCNSYIR